MSDNPKHIKVTNYIQLDDDTTQIDVNSYYEQLAHQLSMMEKHIPTSMNTVLKDLITCLEHMTKEKSPEVVIRIKGRSGEPFEITKRWVTLKESHNRR